jgi:hypothetical protein
MLLVLLFQRDERRKLNHEAMAVAAVPEIGHLTATFSIGQVRERARSIVISCSSGKCAGNQRHDAGGRIMSS